MTCGPRCGRGPGATLPPRRSLLSQPRSETLGQPDRIPSPRPIPASSILIRPSAPRPPSPPIGLSTSLRRRLASSRHPPPLPSADAAGLPHAAPPRLALLGYSVAQGGEMCSPPARHPAPPPRAMLSEPGAAGASVEQRLAGGHGVGRHRVSQSASSLPLPKFVDREGCEQGRRRRTANPLPLFPLPLLKFVDQ